MMMMIMMLAVMMTSTFTVIDDNDDNGTDHCYDNENEKDVDLHINKGETDNYWNNNIGHDDAMAMTMPLKMTFLQKMTIKYSDDRREDDDAMAVTMTVNLL